MGTWITKIFRWLFLSKEIVSRSGQLHFQRWRLFWTPWFALYIHKIYLPDYDKHLHSHPWNFASLILRGFYGEDMPGGIEGYRQPWTIVKRSAEQYHKVAWIAEGPVVTLVAVWGKRRGWGYYVDREMVDHKVYREMKHQ